MPSFSKTLRLIAPGAALAYSVLLTPVAHAQTAPITPVGEVTPGAAPLTTAPVPVAPAPAPSNIPASQIETLSFSNVDVAELLSVIGQQFNVNVLVNGDVSGTLKSINLSNKTPEQAIKLVVMAAGLQYRLQDGTYVIGKALGPDPNAPTTIVPSPNVVPDPAQSFGNPSILPGGTLATGGSSAALPGFGTDVNLSPMSAGGRYSTDDISLVNNSNKDNKGRQTAIRIRNVKASQMAYWLDPNHNQMPVEFQVAQGNNANYGRQPQAQLALPTDAQAILSNSLNSNNPGVVTPGFNPYTRAASQMSPEFQANYQFGGGFGGGGRGGGGGFGGRGGSQSATFDLPGDIEQIIAVDPQNILLVAGGTDDDIRKLQEIINVLDRPLRQVEIEAQFVQVTVTDTRQFGIDFNTSLGNFNANSVGLSPTLDANSGGFQVGFVRGNFQATLNALINKSRAKILTAPRVLAINNLTASIQSLTSTPIVLSSTNAIGGGGGQPVVGTGQNLLYITTQIGLSVTPTINNDDTITVLMQPQISSQTPGTNSVGAPSTTQQFLVTVANVRDGDTIALGGLRLKTITRNGSKIPVLGDIPLIGKLFQQRNALDNDDQLIIFLKATIVRRYGDDEPVPGT